MWDLYMKTSCYGGMAPFLSDARQTHYLNTAFRLGASNNSIVSASNSLTSELRFCPLCKKRDEVAGGWYYHRAHQMPSIKVCYKHGSILRRFTENSVQNFQQAPSQFRVLIQRIRGTRLCCVCKELLDAAPDISAEEHQGGCSAGSEVPRLLCTRIRVCEIEYGAEKMQVFMFPA